MSVFTGLSVYHPVPGLRLGYTGWHSQKRHAEPVKQTDTGRPSRTHGCHDEATGVVHASKSEYGLEDPVHQSEVGEDGPRIQVVLRVKAHSFWMGEFIRPLIEITFDMAGGELRPSFVKGQDELHHDDSCRHLSGFVVKHAENVPLVVRDDWDLDRQLVTLPHPEDTGNEDE